MKSVVLRNAHPKGLDESWRPDPAAADLAVDLRWDPQGAWETCGGYAPLPLSGAGWPAGMVHTLFWFSQHNGTRQWLLHEMEDGAGNLNLYTWNGWNQGVRTTIQTGRTLKQGPWPRTQYLAVGDWAYFINGYDEPSRWNGTYRTRIGFDTAPPPPTVSEFADQDWWVRYLRDYWAAPTDVIGNSPLARGVGPHPTQPPAAGTMPEQWVRAYAIAWFNDLGNESPISEVVFARGANVATNPTAATDGFHQVAVTFPAAPPHARGVRLYCSENLYNIPVDEGRNVRLYRHSEYAFGDTFTILDGKHDDELGAALDPARLGPFPRDATTMALFRGTLFVGARDEVHYSTPALIEQFPPDNVFRLGDRDSGNVTALHATRYALIVFKRRGIYAIRWTGQGFVAETLSEEIGCAAPNAVVDVPGVGVMFVSDDGIHALLGGVDHPGTPTGIALVSGPVSRTWRRLVNVAALVNAVGCLYRADREVWFQIPSEGDDRPKLGLVYHYDVRQWTTRLNWPVSCMVETRDHRGYRIFGSWDTTQPGLHVTSKGYLTKNGTALAGAWMSVWQDMGAGRAQVNYVVPLVVAYGDVNLWVTHRRDHRLAFDRAAYAHDQESQEDTVDQWGTALWSATEVWASRDLVEVPFSIDQQRVLSSQYLLQGSRLHFAAVDLRVTREQPDHLPIEQGVGVEKV